MESSLFLGIIPKAVGHLGIDKSECPFRKFEKRQQKIGILARQDLIKMILAGYERIFPL
jgi:hypothetical protein